MMTYMITNDAILIMMLHNVTFLCLSSKDETTEAVLLKKMKISANPDKIILKSVPYDPVKKMNTHT